MPQRNVTETTTKTQKNFEPLNEDAYLRASVIRDSDELKRLTALNKGETERVSASLRETFEGYQLVVASRFTAIEANNEQLPKSQSV